MDIRQLEYFVAVAEEANFTRAAARVHVAQPGVSAQIRRMERELGEPLLDRSGRRVRLTEAGAAVLPYARAALAAVANARTAVEELTGLMRGRVAVGMVTSCSTVDLPDILADFHKNHEAVEITLTEANSDRLLEALRDGELDLALVGLSTPPPSRISTHVVADEALVLAVGHDDPLAGTSAVSLEETRERVLISLPRGTGVRSCIDSAYAAAGLRPRIAFEASDPNILVRLASRGLGAAILPEGFARAHPAHLHVARISSPVLRARLELAWRSDGQTSPAASALIDHARSALAHRSTD